MNPSELNNYINTGFHILDDSIASKCLVVRARSKKRLKCDVNSFGLYFGDDREFIKDCKQGSKRNSVSEGKRQLSITYRARRR